MTTVQIVLLAEAMSFLPIVFKNRLITYHLQVVVSNFKTGELYFVSA